MALQTAMIGMTLTTRFIPLGVNGPPVHANANKRDPGNVTPLGDVAMWLPKKNVRAVDGDAGDNLSPWSTVTRNLTRRACHLEMKKVQLTPSGQNGHHVPVTVEPGVTAPARMKPFAGRASFKRSLSAMLGGRCVSECIGN